MEEEEHRTTMTLRITIPDSLARCLPLDGLMLLTTQEADIFVPLIRYLLCYRASKQRGTDASQTCG
jgi:hypothetical protein